MRTLLRDVGYAARSLLKRPGVSVVAVVSLGLGIGVTTTAFSLLNAVALRDLPGVAGQDRLVNLGLQVDGDDGRYAGNRLAWPDVELLRERDDLFESVAGAGFVGVALSLTGDPVTETAELVSGNYFSVLGARPYAGRLLAPADDVAGSGTVVLSYRVYEALGVADVVGRRVELNGRGYTVVGVTEPGFTGMMPGGLVDGDGTGPGVWVSLADAPALGPRWTDEPLSRDARWLTVVARLQPGVTTERLEAGLPAVAAAVERSAPELRRNARLQHGPLQFGPGEGGSRVVLLILAFMVVPLLVLLISCANAANLLLARTAERKRELSIRTALGATRGSLVREVLVESVLLALAAAVLGLLVALWSRQIASLYAVRLSMEAPLDLRVFAVTLVTTLGAGVLLGLLPALRAAGPDVAGALKGADRTTGTRGESRLRKGLVVTQVALSLMLLVASGLFIRSARHGMAVPSGMDEARLTLVTFDLDVLDYDAAAGRDFQARLVEHARRVPGVAEAALADRPPLSGGPVARVAPLDAEVDYGHSAQVSYVGDGWFDAAGVELLAGREPTDRASEVVVSRSLAATLWPQGPALGQPLRLGHDDAERVVEVVGMVGDTRAALHQPPQRMLYMPRDQAYSASGTLYVRANDSGRAVAAIRDVVRRLDPRLPLQSVETAVELRERELLAWRLLARGLGTMGLIALVLVVTGLYGVMAFSVARRTREIGVRMALGADRTGVLRMVVGESLGLVGLGLAIGGGLALGVAMLLRSLLFGVSPLDPVTYGALAALLVAVGILAALVPARRAATVEPVRALAE